MKTFITYTLTVFCCLFVVNAAAERFSYVYIQSDKQVPFYVKMEGEMLPRYSKYYTIIPQLAAGPIQIQILFQQNDFPPQTFNILVPQDGHRGFLLTKANNSFALYDLQQKFYLLPGAAGEDHLPELPLADTTPISIATTSSAYSIKPNQKTTPSTQKNYSTNKATTTHTTSKEPVFIEDITLAAPNQIKTTNSKPTTPIEDPKEPEIIVQKQTASSTTPTRIYTTKPTPRNTTPQPAINLANEVAIEEVPQTVSPQSVEDTFILSATIAAVVDTFVMPEPATNAPTEQPASISNAEAIALTKQQPIPPSENIPSENNSYQAANELLQPVEATATSSQPIINTACPTPLSDGKYDDIFLATRAKNTDEKRVVYLIDKADDNCYTSRQAFLLARQLQAESLRYSFLKKIYAHITDQHNFPLLGDALFRTNEWKSYFKLIYE